ncbi:hypothetical protein SAMN06269250_1200 [Spirosoma fluviale]|uniref:Uncharacterized protein n=1 Tax=Spirosoma fluviale TaxID=1597977 RepID=A0A286FB15_9BACT|nr:hypothetical protein SAMN06269250_1200 [Spirosoma fluviale]
MCGQVLKTSFMSDMKFYKPAMAGFRVRHCWFIKPEFLKEHLGMLVIVCDYAQRRDVAPMIKVLPG